MPLAIELTVVLRIVNTLVNNSTARVKMPGANILKSIKRKMRLKNPYRARNIGVLLDFKALGEYIG